MKKMFKLLCAGLLLTGAVGFSANAGDTAASKVKFSGYGYIMSGNIEKGEGKQLGGQPIENYWMNSANVHLNVTSDFKSWFTTNFGLEMQMLTPFMGANAMNPATYYMNYQLFIPAAEGIFHWNYKDPAFGLVNHLKVETGLFPYTFNPAVTNLGNYLYRSSAMPPFVGTQPDYIWANMFGVRAEVGLLDNQLTVEALFNSEIQYVPWFDWCPGLTVAYKPEWLAKTVDVGAGVSFPHLINVYKGWMQPPGTHVSDTVLNQWKSTKIDARAIFDPKPLIADRAIRDFLGPEGGKVYVEAILLGLKDSNQYPGDSLTYGPDTIPANSILHHMPIMAGIDLPTWKILDLLSIEAEYWASPYPNDWFGYFSTQNALSQQVTSPALRHNYIFEDNWKWSIYAKKAFGNFEARALIANDHTIYKNAILSGYPSSEQTMQKHGDWQWMVELRYNL